MPELRLRDLGWSSQLRAEFFANKADGEIPGRVITPDRGYADLLTEQGAMRAMLTGPARFDPPTVGDWVFVLSGNPPTVRQRLARTSELHRKSAGGSSREQCIAANVDVVFVVTDHDQDFNIRRLERYVTAAQDGGARPVIVLNKADAAANPSARQLEASSAFAGISLLSMSALTHDSAAQLLAELQPAQTAVLVGSSGVGKSTLTNALTGKSQQTGGLGQVGKGRHTTTTRSMFALPTGAWLIDTPGMREFGLVDVDKESVEQTFADVQELAARCRFSDCRHAQEPGCAVRAAIDAGDLVPERLQSYEKLQREVAYENSRADEAGRRARKERAKQFAKKNKGNQAKAKRRGHS